MAQGEHDIEKVVEGTEELGVSSQLDAEEMYPQLPVELLVIIAEFLISGFAFGTTAAFNQASHLVRNETLPVLYETVCHEFLDSQDPRPDVENSPGFQYTKFIFRYLPNGKPFDIPLPRLVMSISLPLVIGPPCRINIDSCTLQLHKPLSSRTAFAILKTPVVRRRTDLNACRCRDGECLQFQKHRTQQCPPTFKGPFINRSFNTVVLPVSSICQVELGPGAYLHSHCPIQLRYLRFDLSLSRTELRGIRSHQPAEGETLETALELLKLLGYQRHSGIPTTGSIRELSDSHLKWGMKRTTLDRFIAGLENAAKEVPEIMQNRIRLEVSGVKGLLDFKAILGTSGEVYARFATSSDQVLPVAERIRDDPPVVFAFDASSDPESATSTSHHGTLQSFGTGYVHARSDYAGKVDFDVSYNFSE